MGLHRDFKLLHFQTQSIITMSSASFPDLKICVISSPTFTLACFDEDMSRSLSVRSKENKGATAVLAS